VTATEVSFLSWYRSGLSAGVGAPSGADPLALAPPPEVSLALGLTVGDPAVGGETAAANATARLHGPGDVGGLDPAQVVRMWPPPGAQGAATDSFPLVEFAHPALPWLFTPTGPATVTDPAAGRRGLLPWLALVVVESTAAELDASGPGLPRLTVSTSELPDLAQAHLWAHAQLTQAAIGDDPVATLDADPTTGISRLLSPRRLAAATSYLACVVPTFDIGVTAGLAGAVATQLPATAGPAWPSPLPQPPATVTLPVYLSWTFATGPAGDFLSLLRRLRPAAADGFGTRPLDISAAGGNLPAAPQGTQWTISLEGALIDPAAARGSWPDGVPQLQWQQVLASQFSQDGKRLVPPTYGAAQSPALPPPQPGTGWRDQLNLDPRYRAAAALGATLVREQQQGLLLSAWQQLGELAGVNQVLSRGQLASEVGGQLYQARLGPGGAAGPPLADADLLRVTSAVHGQIAAGAEAAAGTADAALAGTVAGQIAVNPSLPGVLSPAFRRLARPAGPLARRLATVAVPPPVAPVAASGHGGITAVPPLAPVSGLVDVSGLSGGDASLRGISSESVGTPSLAWEAGATVAAVAPRALVVTGAATPAYLSDLLIMSDAGDTIGRVLDWDGHAIGGWQAASLGPGRDDLPLHNAAAHVTSGQVLCGAVSMINFNGSPDSPAVAAIQFSAYVEDASEGGSDAPPYWTWSVELMLHGDVLPGAGASPVSGGDAPGEGPSLTFATGDITWPDPTPVNGITPPSPDYPPLLNCAVAIAAGPTPGYPEPTVVTVHQVIEGDDPDGGLLNVCLFSRLGPDGQAASTSSVQWDARMGLPTGAAFAGGALYLLAGPNLYRAYLGGTPLPGYADGITSYPGAVPAGATGVALAAADFTGTGLGDLVVFFSVPTVDETGAMVSRTVARVAYGLGDEADTVEPTWSDLIEVDAALSPYGGNYAMIGSIDRGTDAVRQQVAASFRAAAADAQAKITPVIPAAPPPDPTPIDPAPLAALAAQVRGSLDPSATVPGVVAARLQNAPLTEVSTETLYPLRAGVSFPQPLGDRVAAEYPDRLIPGIGAFPDESLAILASDPATVEAIIVGANSELSRELLWNRVPADRTATFFSRFWDSVDAATGGPANDLTGPIGGWPQNSALGAHLTAASDAVLVLRGEFVRRFPQALICACPAVPPPAGSGSATRMPDLTSRTEPLFAGQFGPDTRYLGFSFSVATATGGDGGLGYYLVFQEHAASLRFGLDEPQAAPAAFGQPPQYWRLLDWSATVRDAADYAAITYVDTSAGSPLAGVALADTSAGGSAHHWAFSSADMAHVSARTPVLVAIHVQVLLGSSA
jgi:hypothetical protein